MSRIGIIGGTFNPIHNGHIQIAQAAYKQYQLDEILFMPNHIPAYKNTGSILPGFIRLQMVQLAIEEYPGFYASDFELKREGITYTYETLRQLKKDHPNDSFFFIMGADSLFQFTTWKYPEKILLYTDILVACRDGNDDFAIAAKIEELNTFYRANAFHIIQIQKINCSSHEIRKALSKQTDSDLCVEQQAKALQLPIKVLQYIKSNHLYQRN